MSAPESLVDICLRVITDLEHLKRLTQFESIRERMFHVFDHKLQQYLLGESKTWHANGTLREHAYYRDGRLHGKCREWYSTGMQRKISFFRRGVLNGEYRDWYPTGYPKSHINFADGRLYGECCWWFADGNVDCHSLYSDGYIERDLP